MKRQLALSLQFNNQSTMADFNFNGQELLSHQLTQMVMGEGVERFVYLFGGSGTGKSHLLQACCQLRDDIKSFYCPLSSMKAFGPLVLDGLEHYDLLCLDELDEIASIPEWEEALFHLYNRIRDAGNVILMMAGRLAPKSMPILLPDLQSRLSWGLVIGLFELKDQDKISVLQDRSHKRGFIIPDAAAQFIMNHVGRDMHRLNEIVLLLDEASLAQRRKITIPFIKEILGI